MLSKQIPWDKISNIYNKQLNNDISGAKGINPRVAIGAIIIKHICDLSDQETILQIQENVYMQYFIGYSGFSDEPVFDSSLFVDLRKRFGVDQINEINETIMGLGTAGNKGKKEDVQQSNSSDSETLNDAKQPEDPTESLQEQQLPAAVEPPPNKGELLVDATACPQDISYPTDLNLLNDAREVSENLIDILYWSVKLLDQQKQKPRTYREIARKEYLKVAQKKQKTKKQIRHALRKQLSYLNRNIKYILQLLKYFKAVPLTKKEYKYFIIVRLKIA
jgi:hypothetical protein